MALGGMRFSILLACFALSSASLATPRVTPDPTNRSVARTMRALDVHVGGRAAREPLSAAMPAGAKSYVHQWPGVYFEAAFTGDSVVLKFDDAANEYRLLIDDLTPIALPQPGRTEIRIDRLASGRHRLRLEKLTESVSQVGAFQGFYVPPGAVPGQVTARPRQIEFIGDSSMTGYGNRAGKSGCTDEEVRLTTDTQQAYPTLVAKHFDADYQIIARSGHGLVRNYGGFGPDVVMPLIYPYAVLERKLPYSDPRWQPQIIVIRLIADLLLPLNPGEKWPVFSRLTEDYVKAYGAFIAELHRRSPDAAFVVWWFDLDSLPDLETARDLAAWKDLVAADARAAGVETIEFLPMANPGFDMNACHAHYSLADHRKMAQQLVARIEALPQPWRRKAAGRATFPAPGPSSRR